MNSEFYRGRRVLITGAASGMGLALTEGMLERGACVALVDQDEATLREHTARLRAGGRAAFGYQLDVTDRTGWDRVRDAVVNDLGGIDLLANNAGIMATGWTSEAIPPSVWDKVIAVNLTGIYNGVRAVVPTMIRQGTGGHIINTASMSALRCLPLNGAYSAAKAGVVALSETMRLELAPHGIGVTVVAPGVVQTPLLQNSERVISAEAGSGGRAASPNLLDLAGTIGPGDLASCVLAAVEESHAYVVTHLGERDQVTRQQRLVQDAFDRLDAR